MGSSKLSKMTKGVLCLLVFITLGQGKPGKPQSQNIAKLAKENGNPPPRTTVDTLSCQDTFDLSEDNSIAIETKNYPSNYPNRYRCKWYFNVAPNTNTSMYCESFDVHRSDRLCIYDYYNYNYQCFYGTELEGFTFPFDFGITDEEGFIQMKFRSGRRRTGEDSDVLYLALATWRELQELQRRQLQNQKQQLQQEQQPQQHLDPLPAAVAK